MVVAASSWGLQHLYRTLAVLSIIHASCAEGITGLTSPSGIYSQSAATGCECSPGSGSIPFNRILLKMPQGIRGWFPSPHSPCLCARCPHGWIWTSISGGSPRSSGCVPSVTSHTVPSSLSNSHNADNVIISTFAGNGSAGYSGDGGPAVNATLQNTNGVAVGPDGTVYFADAPNHAIRAINPTTGIIRTFAGNGVSGYDGDNVHVNNSRLNTPRGVATDRHGNVYICDNGNNRIRVVDIRSGIITTVVGNGTKGVGGDDMPGPLAQVSNPRGLVINDLRGILYWADVDGNKVRKLERGIVRLVAGSPTGAPGYAGDGAFANTSLLKQPRAVAVDKLGHLIFISDGGNNCVRFILGTTGGGLMRTLMGVCTQSGSSPDSDSSTRVNATTALLNNPFGLVYDAVMERIFVADAGNNRIRYVNLRGERGLFINRWAGTGVGGFSGDGGLATEARLRNPQTMAFSPKFDKMYIGDTTNLRLRVTTQTP